MALYFHFDTSLCFPMQKTCQILVIVPENTQDRTIEILAKLFQIYGYSMLGKWRPGTEYF